MTTITLVTEINADKKTVFDLSRNIDLHQESMKTSKEKAMAGSTSGLIERDETVTFRGKTLRHLSDPSKQDYRNDTLRILYG